jgi:hypothetical protein
MVRSWRRGRRSRSLRGAPSASAAPVRAGCCRARRRRRRWRCLRTVSGFVQRAASWRSRRIGRRRCASTIRTSASGWPRATPTSSRSSIRHRLWRVGGSGCSTSRRGSRRRGRRGARQLRLETLPFRFAVSSDEEHVVIYMKRPSGEARLPSRAHDYMLLTLARARLQDRSAGCSPAEEG